MSARDDLYGELLHDHGRSPRNFRSLENSNARAEGYNPLCGDHLFVYLKLDGDRVADIAFQGEGCEVARSSASLMTEALRGKTREEAEALFEDMHKLVTQGPQGEEEKKLGKLAAFSSVWKYPVRVKCASLAWHTMRAALRGQDGVSTE